MLAIPCSFDFGSLRGGLLLAFEGDGDRREWCIRSINFKERNMNGYLIAAVVHHGHRLEPSS